MNIQLPLNLLQRIHTHAEEAYPNECCGFLLGNALSEQVRIVHDVEAVHNPSADEGIPDRYRIDAADYLRVDRRARATGWDILGCYHSHPDEEPVPSEVDLACAWPWYVYLIVAVHNGDVAEERGWTLIEDACATSRRFHPVAIELCNK